MAVSLGLSLLLEKRGTRPSAPAHFCHQTVLSFTVTPEQTAWHRHLAQKALPSCCLSELSPVRSVENRWACRFQQSSRD
ncbi:hypothetical protein NQZ68_031154, partial [Dissostichus eleginoides]